MPRTAQLRLPLLMPAQAQKHVTVNEALVRLDALAQLRLRTAAGASVPDGAEDGTAFVVPPGAAGAWAGRDGDIAVRSNGGWEFVRPRTGWRAWDPDRSEWCVFDGGAWLDGAVALSAGGATTFQRVIEFDHAIVPGAQNSTSVQIPAACQVVGVTGRVLEAIVGTNLAGWQLGVQGSTNRYGSGLGVARNSYVTGLTGTPVTYYSNTALVLSAEGGSFSEGLVRLAVHLVSLAPPRAV